MPLLTGTGQAHHGTVLREAAALAEGGKLRPLLNKQRFSWADIDAAHSLVESGALGKVVVDPLESKRLNLFLGFIAGQDFGQIGFSILYAQGNGRIDMGSRRDSRRGPFCRAVRRTGRSLLISLRSS
jgi:hypothetical protein